LQDFNEIFLLDAEASIRSNQEAIFSNSKESVLARVREVVFLDWKRRESHEKVSDSFAVFSDPKLIALLGLNGAATPQNKFRVDSNALPTNLELESWSRCVNFEK
jgi:hypothetical protein